MAVVQQSGLGGRVFTFADVSRLGSDVSVRKALSRLVSPNPDAIVAAVARRDRVTILPDNLVAAKDVGFADAVSDKSVYLTTDNPKIIAIASRPSWPSGSQE